ncbi:hypothetical protein BCR34DRAFT_535696 [Clohesyomyces aquaticus]|uniref:Pentatricopeptide repeat protein n=1 Tax=Clohesyomyces aquaticus TaxID=1231657 RepID=A0A1Y1ZT42_9PLEO|nr:hypothetical protein BCR34DRAFT_535696 [Clohesyomyces aquaticus]
MSSYICRQCRSRILQCTASLRSPHLRSASTFTSLRRADDVYQPTPSDAQDQTPNPDNDTNAGSGETKGPRIIFDRGQGARVEGAFPATKVFTPGRYSRYTQPASEGENRTPIHLDKAGFGSSAADSNAETGPWSIRKPRTYESQIETSIRAGSLHAAWEQLLTKYPSKDCAALVASGEKSERSVSGRTFGLFQHTVTKEFCRGANVPVSPTEALKKLEGLGVGFPKIWETTLRTLTHQVLRESTLGEQPTQRSNDLLLELISVWRLFFRYKGSFDLDQKLGDDAWPLIPNAQALRAENAGTAVWDFPVRLQRYHPKVVGSPSIGFCAATIFSILNERKSPLVEVDDNLRVQNEPFLRLLAHTLAGADIESPLGHTSMSEFQALPESVRKNITEKIKVAPSEAMARVGLKYSDLPARPGRQDRDPLEAMYFGKIARAVRETARKDILGKIWDDVVREYTQTDGKSAVPSRLYNAFLTGFMAVFEPSKSIEVWNHMIASGIVPDAKSWTAMLTGCERARDLNGLKQMWARMVASGVRPDIYAWTARIHALMFLRNSAKALEAMDEMGRNWIAGEQAMKAASKPHSQTPTPKVNPHVKPTIEVVNAAISGMVGIRNLRFESKAEMVQKILLWGCGFGLKPDAHTYNTLIQFYLSASDYKTASRLLRNMESEGLEPDIVTYTTLLRAAFDDQSFSAATPSLQTEKVLTILNGLEAQGLKLNSYLYSSAVDRLLKQHNNFSAARAVVQHMTSRNLIPGPQMYTSLISHYFQADPPDVDAVDAIWLQISSVPGTPVDKVLFDRTIEGYARVGEVGKMMATLGRMSSQGKLPGYTALAAVVRALAEAGEFDRARDVVRDVSNGEGVARGGITGATFGRKDFWDTVREFGVLEDGREFEGALHEYAYEGEGEDGLGEVEEAGDRESVDAGSGEMDGHDAPAPVSTRPTDHGAL